MKSRIGYFLLFLSVFVLSMIVMTPASFVASKMQEYIPEVEMYGVDGTLWSGQSQAVVVSGELLKNVEWQLSPWPLLVGNVRLAFSSISSELHSEGVVDFDLLTKVVALSDTMIRFPIDHYANKLGIADFGLAGQFELNLAQLSYQDGVLSDVKGVFIWREAGVSNALQLGDLQAELQQQDGTLNATLSDLQGPVSLSGTFSLQGTGQYQIKSTLGARDNGDVNLKQALRLLGRSIGESKVQVENKGKITMPTWLALS